MERIFWPFGDSSLQMSFPGLFKSSERSLGYLITRVTTAILYDRAIFPRLQPPVMPQPRNAIHAAMHGARPIANKRWVLNGVLVGAYGRRPVIRIAVASPIWTPSIASPCGASGRCGKYRRDCDCRDFHRCPPPFHEHSAAATASRS